jgi:hypothetical protein
MLRANQLVGFGVGGSDITVIPETDFGAPSSGDGTDTHTFTSPSLSGPEKYFLVTWRRAVGATTLDSATWGGAAVTILVQGGFDAGGETVGAAIGYCANASGNIVLNFSLGANSYMSLASLSGAVTPGTAVDTDSESANGTADLDSLTTPGDGGARLAVYANQTDTTAVTWTNATEFSDADAGTWRHSAAYDLGDDGTAIAADGAAAGEVIVGVSIR